MRAKSTSVCATTRYLRQRTEFLLRKIHRQRKGNRLSSRIFVKKTSNYEFRTLAGSQRENSHSHVKHYWGTQCFLNCQSHPGFIKKGHEPC